MSSKSLLDLPKELLAQVLDQLSPSELRSPALACGLLNTNCERRIYRSVSVIKYAYSHVGETDYDVIRCFFRAIKKRPQRLSYVKEVDARLELRMDAGLHHACELFETLPKMPCLTDLSLAVVGGVKPHRGNRQLEQAMIWGCTFERGRMAIYKFFRMNTNTDELRGLHALQSLRRLKIVFPSNSIGLQTDLMAYSALQHQSITMLELHHVVNASLAPPKLPEATEKIIHLTLKGCKLPTTAYQCIFKSMSALEHLDLHRLPGGLVQALAYHSSNLRSLCLKVDAAEMVDLDLSELISLRHLQVNNPVWNEDTLELTEREPQDCIALPAASPPFLETLTMKNFHRSNLGGLFDWMEASFAPFQTTAIPHLKELRLEAQYLGDEYIFDRHSIFAMTASCFHINSRVQDTGKRLYRELGIELCVKETIIFGQKALAPGPYETGPGSTVLRLSWKCLPDVAECENVQCVKADMSPRGAMERLLLTESALNC